MTHEAKKALAGQLPTVGRSMCVEISLKTSEVMCHLCKSPTEVVGVVEVLKSPERVKGPVGLQEESPTHSLRVCLHDAKALL